VATVRIAWFGDVVGRPGRAAFARAAPVARAEHGADLVIVNGENARHGMGLHPEGYRALRDAGADAVTLGDHALDDHRAPDLLADPVEPVLRPWNLDAPEGAKRRVTLETPGRPLALLSIVGNLFMRPLATPAFDALEDALGRLEVEAPDALALVEVHAEATSEKIALARHAAALAPGRVVAVVGTHTHVQTSDARLIDGRVAALTDLGMCGSTAGVIGFDLGSSVRKFRGQSPIGLGVASGAEQAQGALIEVDLDGGRAVSISTLRVPERV
jgi:metallophosphoesterase (TIGR00282 family)